MKIVALGIAQGLTEFLPVSSSGHLYLIKRLINLPEASLAFFVLLHLATVLAIIVFFGRQIIADLFQKKILFHLGLITIITAIIGLSIDKFLVELFENKFWIALLLCLNGGILLSIKKTFFQKNLRDYRDITFKDSLFLGLVQGLAVFPGISRSGITITALLKKGIAPASAFTFSFLMAIPAIFGAALLKLPQLTSLTLSVLDISMGFLAAFISGFFALKLVKKMLISQRFSLFGYYCIAISLASLFF